MAEIITSVITAVIAIGAMATFFADTRKSTKEHEGMQKNRTLEHDKLSTEHKELSSEHDKLSIEHNMLKEKCDIISKQQCDITDAVKFLRDAELIRRGKAEGVSARTMDFNRTVDELKSMAERLIAVEKENAELRKENHWLHEKNERLISRLERQTSAGEDEFSQF